MVNKNPIADVIVLGLGGMGLACVKEIAQKGLSVIGFDQFNPLHENGSSHGDSRVFRTAYFEDPAYVPLLKSSADRWQTWSQEAGRCLLDLKGLYTLSSQDDSAIHRGILESAAFHNLEVVQYRGSKSLQGIKNLPGLIGANEGVFEADAGIIDVEATLGYLLQAANKPHVSLCWDSKVIRFNPLPTGIEVITESGCYQGRKLVITAGAWLKELLPEIPLSLEVNFHCWFPGYENAEKDQALWAMETDNGFFYGFPADASNGLMKINLHGTGITVAHPAQTSSSDSTSVLEKLNWFFNRHWPGYNPEPSKVKPCLYTNTPDGHFILDTLPGNDNILVMGGFSGHGFKFLPVIGDIGAEFAITGERPDLAGIFRLSRF